MLMIDMISEMDGMDRDLLRKIAKAVLDLAAEHKCEGVTPAALAFVLMRFGACLSVDALGKEASSKVFEYFRHQIAMGELRWSAEGQSEAEIRQALLDMHADFAKAGQKHWALGDVNTYLSACGLWPIARETYLRLMPGPMT